MKNSIKSMAAVFLAGLVMTGCIDTAVAPEVKAIREQQVALLAAKAQLAVAEAKSQEIENAHETAMNALAEQEATAQLVATLADIDVQTEFSKGELEQAKLALQQAVDAMAEYIASHGTDVAADLLDAYSDAANTLNGMVGDQVTKQADLAKATAILNSVNADWVVAKAALTKQLASENATLTAQQATLTSVQAAAAGTTTNATLLANLKAENADLEVKLEENRIKDKQQVRVALDARDANNAGHQTVNDYNSAVADTASTSATLASQQDALADMQSDLADLTATLTVKTGNLADWTAAYTPLKATYDTKVAASATKLLALQAAENDLAVAQQKEAAGTGTAAQTTAAQTAKDNAQTAYDAAVTAENTAFDNLDQVDDGFFNAQDEAAAAQTNVDNQNDNIANQQNTISETQVELVDEINAVNDLQEAYDAVDLAALQTAEDAAWRAEDLIDLERDSLNAKWDANDFVISRLEDYFDNLNDIVDGLQSDIDDTRADIESTTESIADQDVAKANQQSEVDTLTAELADIQAEITAQQAIVDARWAALETALGL
jgi:hypothetical protein